MNMYLCTQYTHTIYAHIHKHTYSPPTHTHHPPKLRCTQIILNWFKGAQWMKCNYFFPPHTHMKVIFLNIRMQFASNLVHIDNSKEYWELQLKIRRTTDCSYLLVCHCIPKLSIKHNCNRYLKKNNLCRAHIILYKELM